MLYAAYVIARLPFPSTKAANDVWSEINREFAIGRAERAVLATALAGTGIPLGVHEPSAQVGGCFVAVWLGGWEGGWVGGAAELTTKTTDKKKRTSKAKRKNKQTSTPPTPPPP